MSLLTSVTPYRKRVRCAMLDDKPASPNALDDEFESVNLNAAWTRGGSLAFDDVNAIDPYAGFATGARSSHNSYRPSWWMVQCGSGQYFTLSKAITPGTDFCAWARLSYSARYSTNANNDPEIGINLLADAAGAPDLNNRVMCYLVESAAGVQHTWAGKVVAGVFTVTNGQDKIPGSLANSALQQQFCYVLIQKTGTTYSFAVGNTGGHWLWLTAQTHASTMAWFSIIGNGGSTAAPGCCITGVDFVRFKDSKFLP